ncbi:unannotated protein [freshwater metagenome]|uniref:Unannotated protein n=1 Tax=freshwater metagenome TaxID=449393 RepID=A0A6J6BW60_9ZZZZ|nr:response regulator [Actinomycetota bacterium]
MSTDSTQILVVEDSPTWQQLIQVALEDPRYVLTTVDTASAARDSVETHNPMLILLDIGLPDADGFELCKELRSQTDAYILILTAKNSEIDRVLGLSLGADDYVTKPFSARELSARVHALLRRTLDRPRTTTVRHLGDLVLDTGAHLVTLNDEVVELTRTEFDLLDALSEQVGQAWTRRDLLQRIWGDSYFGSDNLVDTHIANLRKKIDAPGAPSRVNTVRGVGYRLSL